MTKAYAANEPEYGMETYINDRVPIISNVIASSYFFPDLVVTEATTVSSSPKSVLK